ncbi:hypothetical protein Rhsp01_58640 [Rhizobium sp. NBRC 114257]|uniref:Uncharacterized protein n=1 Tax=Rhizobium dioscoreae TaxID=2653122 RepID=A0ABQ0ZDG9_9HYPH|nr:hypothetical protein RsS93_58620 [Rhizobium dioscoreae]GLU84688.1 hypothetical protein Rhsp01_58640 [Rhizobium sp. NBRC 114257]
MYAKRIAREIKCLTDLVRFNQDCIMFALSNLLPQPDNARLIDRDFIDPEAQIDHGSSGANDGSNSGIPAHIAKLLWTFSSFE